MVAQHMAQQVTNTNLWGLVVCDVVWWCWKRWSSVEWVEQCEGRIRGLLQLCVLCGCSLSNWPLTVKPLLLLPHQ